LTFITILTISGMLIFLGCVFATGLYKYGGHRIQKRNLYCVALAAFFSICIFGFMEPKSPESIMMALGLSAPIAFFMAYFQIRWFSKRQVDGKLMVSKSTRRNSFILCFCTVVLCNLIVRTHWGSILMKLYWLHLSLCLGWLFSTLFFVWYIAKVEQKLGQSITEKIKNT